MSTAAESPDRLGSGQEEVNFTNYADLLPKAEDPAGNGPSEDEKRAAREKAIDNVILWDAARLISSLATNEQKALTFAAMATAGGRTLSSRDIYDLFLGMQGEGNRAWGDMAHGGPAQYANQSFEPIGAVVKSTEQTARGQSARYTVNSYGEKVGLATVGLMLDLSERFPDTSLHSLFGKTSTNSPDERRSPYTRLQVLNYLMQRSGDSEAPTVMTIARDLAVDQNRVTMHLQELTHTHLATVDSSDRHASDRKIWVADQSKFENIEFKSNRGDMPERMQEYFQDQQAAGEAEIMEEALFDHLSHVYPDQDPEILRDTMRKNLSRWEEQGFVGIDSDFSLREKTRVRLDANNEAFVQELLIAVQGIMEGDENYLAWGQRRAVEIMHDSERVNALLRKGKEASPYKNQLPLNEFQDLVMGIVGDRELDVEAVRTAVERSGKPASRDGVREVLTGLVNSSSLTYRQEGRVRYYSKPAEIK